MAIEYIGPIGGNYYLLTIDGYQVPHIKATKNPNGTWYLHLDGSACLPEITDDEIDKFLWFFVEAMAVSAGYTCFGKGAKEVNKFKVRMIPLSAPDIEHILKEVGEVEK